MPLRATCVALAVYLATASAARASAPASQPCETSQPVRRAISPGQAVVLGFVEGLTEYLPVSSTGHLILTSHFLGLDADPSGREALNAFEVVIQVGALLAVVGLYRRRVGQMARGLIGRDRAGLRLLLFILTAFAPAAVLGLVMEDTIDSYLFAPAPVVGALAAGGVLMVVLDGWRRRAEQTRAVTIENMTLRMAVLIGLAQCLAMWPGTSRSMVTIVAAILVGMRAASAAEFSFLLALPTLAGASFVKLVRNGPELLASAGAIGLVLGVTVSCLVAAVAVKAFVAYLNRHGLAPFGLYRIALAGTMLGLVWAGRMSF